MYLVGESKRSSCVDGLRTDSPFGIFRRRLQIRRDGVDDFGPDGLTKLANCTNCSTINWIIPLSDFLVVVLHHVANKRQQLLVGQVLWNEAHDVSKHFRDLGCITALFTSDAGVRILAERDNQRNQDGQLVCRNDPNKARQRFYRLDLHVVLDVFQQCAEGLYQAQVSDFLAEALGDIREILREGQPHSPALVFSRLNNNWEGVCFIVVTGEHLRQ